MSEHAFYTDLAPLKSFHELTDEGQYATLPDDWCVVITDIEGSTKAIEKGRYKDVNLVGAATIAAARNALSGQDIPFVFGGDGASFAFHADDRSKVEAAMNGLRRMAVDNFHLTLRIGLVPVSALSAAGAAIKVARYELSSGRHLALFQGTGLPLAEKWVKQPNSEYRIEDQEGATVNTDGLSCRWNAIPNIRGVVVTMIIQKTELSSNQIYADLLEHLSQLCGGDFNAVNPVNIPKVSYQSIRECFVQEKRLHLPQWTLKFLYRIWEIIVCVCIFRFKIPPLFMDPDRYTHSMREHADYCKFDGALRMVVDVSLEQRDRIQQFLHSLQEEGQIYYGLHESTDSLMTCYVDTINDGGHIHFIDGARGGYAMAAKQLKMQMSAGSPGHF